MGAFVLTREDKETLIQHGVGVLETADGRGASTAALQRLAAALDAFDIFGVMPHLGHEVMAARVGAVLAAMASHGAEEWVLGLHRHWREKRHFMVHAYLEQTPLGRKLRQIYGKQRERWSAAHCEKLALPVAEVEDLIQRGVIKWPAPHHPPRELMCKGSEKVFTHASMFYFLNALRKDMGDERLWVQAHWRSPGYNAALDGASSTSPLLTADAMELSVVGHDPLRLMEACRERGARWVHEYSAPGDQFLEIGFRRDLKRKPHRVATGPGFAGGARARPTDEARRPSGVRDVLAVAGGVAAMGGVVVEKIDTLQNIEAAVTKAEQAVASAEAATAVSMRAISVMNAPGLWLILLCLAIWFLAEKWKRLRLGAVRIGQFFGKLFGRCTRLPGRWRRSAS